MKLACEQTEHERAVSIALSFADQQREMWSSLWPRGHCAVSSLLLCPILRAGTGNQMWRVAIGRVRVFDEMHRHAWCELRDEIIIDITFSQFLTGSREKLRATPMRVATNLDNLSNYLVYTELTLQREEEARNSIRSTGNSDGWMPGSIIKQVFGEMENQDID